MIPPARPVPSLKKRLTRALDTWEADAPWLVPAVLVMGLCQGCMYIPYLLGPAGIGLGALVWEQPALTATYFCAISAAMLLVEIAHRLGRTGVLALCHMGPLQIILFVLGGSAVALHVSVPAPLPGLLIGCIGAALFGIATAWAQLESARFLARLQAKASNRTVLLATPVTGAIVIVASLARKPWLAVVVALLPICIPLLIERAEANAPFSAPSNEPKETLGPINAANSWRSGIVTCCSIVTAALVVFAGRYDLYTATGISTTDVTWAHPVALAAAGTVLCIGVLVTAHLLCTRPRTITLTLVFRISLPLLGAGSLLVCLTPSNATGPTMAGLWTAIFAMALIDQMVWVLTAAVMRSTHTNSDLVVTRMRMMQFLGAALGAVFALPAIAQWGTMPAILTATTVLLAAFVLLVPSNELHIVRAASLDSAASCGLDSAVSQQCALAAIRYDLTAREAEVFCLLAEGLAVPQIAQRLCVSHPTVRTHVRHIYTKFDVHSRAELVSKAGIDR